MKALLKKTLLAAALPLTLFGGVATATAAASPAPSVVALDDDWYDDDWDDLWDDRFGWDDDDWDDDWYDD